MKRNKLLNYIYRSKLFRIYHFVIKNKYDRQEYKINDLVDDLRFINFYNINKLNKEIMMGGKNDN